MVCLNKLSSIDIKEIWRIGYCAEDPAWVKYDAPFLHDYEPLSWEQFEETQGMFFRSEFVQGIFIENQIIGAVNYYWEERQTRWLEIGIVIFSSADWGKNYGSQGLKAWTTEMFRRYPQIERVGFTTWSGNPGMIRLGEKNGFRLEGRLRKARYYQGEYYDEVHFGVLRSEWEKL